MKQVFSLYELIQQAGCDYCIFDFGRRVQALSKQEFESFEKCETPYPTPIQQHARFALVYWPVGNSQNPYIWFLNLPLDEQSCLVPGARNHFVAIIQEALGDAFAKQQEETQQKLPDNPYIKLPDSNKIALVNAAIKYKFKRPASQAMQECICYLNGSDKSQWRNLSVQGWADLFAHTKDPKVQQAIDSDFFNWPEDLFKELLPLLEHTQLSRALTNKLIRQLACKKTDLKASVPLLRCLAANSDQVAVQDAIYDFMQSHSLLGADINALIAARAWPALQNPLLLIYFLEQLASDDADVFAALFKDLVALPTLRRSILTLMQNPQSLPQTRQAVTMMMAKNNGPTH
ncbi:DUF3549 family protein [Gayadomonas joobiniege]|uniref:DUF3549 family protein n=1 Tax=Gayadomonas joobiniege TaxID=1234606 RepID=UPI00037D287E|nr:DUF3549 family protein [Gayadomonas joobiniege]